MLNFPEVKLYITARLYIVRLLYRQFISISAVFRLSAPAISCSLVLWQIYDISTICISRIIYLINPWLSNRLMHACKYEIAWMISKRAHLVTSNTGSSSLFFHVNLMIELHCNFRLNARQKSYHLSKDVNFHEFPWQFYYFHYFMCVRTCLKSSVSLHQTRFQKKPRFINSFVFGCACP